MEDAYLKSNYSKIIEDESLSPVEREKSRNISFFYEFYLIFYRSLICQIRNPMDVGLKVIQSVFTALIVIVVFGQVKIYLCRLIMIIIRISGEYLSFLFLRMHLEVFKEH